MYKGVGYVVDTLQNIDPWILYTIHDEKEAQTSRMLFVYNQVTSKYPKSDLAPISNFWIHIS